MWLANGVPEASRIGYELCGWLMTFLRPVQFGYELYGWPMAFLRKFGYMYWPVDLGMSYMAGQWRS